MICPIDVDEMYGSGNYDTTEAENLMVVFEKCNPDKVSYTCADEIA